MRNNANTRGKERGREGRGGEGGERRKLMGHKSDWGFTEREE